MKVAIIGGGPSGLATLKFLKTAHEYFPIPPAEARLFEATNEIGGTFTQRVYEDAELVSSKYLTTFSDFRLPPEAPDFVTPARYVQYLDEYVAHFNIRDHINLSAPVQKVERYKNGHRVTFKKADGNIDTYECDAVAVCSGLNVHPRIPNIKGIEKVAAVMHSSDIKGRSQFGENTNVVVLGAGETGMDMGHLAVTSPTKSITICHRTGFFCGPKIIPTPRNPRQPLTNEPQNKPVDTSVASLFDTAYAHPVLQRSFLLWFAYDQWVKKMHTLISGTEEGPDQWVGQMDPERKHLDSVFLVKSDRALPYMSECHRSTSRWNKIRQSIINVPLKETNGRRIDVTTWPTKIDDDGFLRNEDAQFDGKIKPDVIVFATGYDVKFSFLNEDYPALADAKVRGIYSPDDISVGYIGFVRPSIGAIPPLAELQTQLWVLRLLQHHFPRSVSTKILPNAIEGYEMDYKLNPRAGYDLFTHKRGVDHEAYAYQLALDIGSAPTITYIMRKGWKIFFTWAMGSNFNPKFRLVGPWRWENRAEMIMSEELYNVVKRSGGGVYLVTYTIIPFIIFGGISISLYAVFGIADFFMNLFGMVLGLFMSEKPNVNDKRKD
ncbi:hypothetical protein N3K66_003949 [Trichothecium roseum]|uniref:Uncharacterized protein n=1 Tax=Trichothecium roseum TaxID=47278 RepID=A0ACC0V8P0_9HYPO|nr:hypothetical protein N3K66_003949 [Trichothecium roseum]